MSFRFLSSKPLISCILGFCFLLTGCSIPKSAENLDTTASADIGDRKIIPYADMVYERPDIDNLEEQITQLTNQLNAATSFEAAKQVDESMDELLGHFNTQNTLAMLGSYHDTMSTFYDDEYRFMEDASAEIEPLVDIYQASYVSSQFSAQFKEEIGEYAFQSIENKKRLNNTDVKTLKQQRNQLTVDYNQLLSNSTVTIKNKEYTLDDIYSSSDPEKYVQFFDQQSDAFFNIFKQLIDVNKQIAQKLDFDSVADMYYLSYSRDYTPAEALTYCNNTKEIITPVADLFGAKSITENISQKKLFDTMPLILHKVSPDLTNAWNAMEQYGLYDISAADNKRSSVSFTTYLPEYDAPFFYTYWQDNFSSVTTSMHEFGHFYDYWLHYDVSTVSNLDIAETYSQSLELLLQPSFSSFTTQVSNAVLSRLASFVSTLQYQSLLEEFTQRAYEMEDLTANNLGQLFAELKEEYGITAIKNEQGLDLTWYEITHLFDSPFYTISYWTSACTSLQIWSQSQDNWDTAKQTYLDMLNANQNQAYTELVKSVGLLPPSDPQVLKNIVSDLEAVFNNPFSIKNDAA